MSMLSSDFDHSALVREHGDSAAASPGSTHPVLPIPENLVPGKAVTLVHKQLPPSTAFNKMNSI